MSKAIPQLEKFLTWCIQLSLCKKPSKPDVKVFHHPTAITDLLMVLVKISPMVMREIKSLKMMNMKRDTCIGSEGGGEGHSTAGNLPS